MVRVFIGLGSNLGDREAALRAALGALAATDGVRVLARSALYETDPVGPPPQAPYLNAAAMIETSLSAQPLLARLHEIESAAGRIREGAARNSARTLDLDILLFGDATIDEAGLVVPHPRLHERPFVLTPLRELAARVRHPVLGATIEELELRVRDERSVRRVEERAEESGWRSRP